MFTLNRLISATGVLAITLGLALTAMGQQSSGVNTSRSNIKNNINVVEVPPGKVRCVVTGEKIAKDCTKDQVDLLNKALTTSAQKEQASSAQRASKSAKPLLSLAPNGSLLCDKKPCTAGDLSDVNKAAMDRGENAIQDDIAYTRNASTSDGVIKPADPKHPDGDASSEMQRAVSTKGISGSRAASTNGTSGGGVMEATSVSQSLTCLPADVKDTEIAATLTSWKGGSPVVTRVTVGQKLMDLKARCSKNGTLIDATGKEIIFHRLTNCYGTPPPDLEKRVKKEQDEINAAIKKGTVIEITCNPSGVPIP